MELDNKQIETIHKRCEKKDLGSCCGLYAEVLKKGKHLPGSKETPKEIENWLDTLLPEIKNQEELTHVLSRCIRKISNAGLVEDDIMRVVNGEISRIRSLRLRKKRKIEETKAKELEEKKELTKA